jgi:hypothetical protein
MISFRVMNAQFKKLPFQEPDASSGVKRGPSSMSE